MRLRIQWGQHVAGHTGDYHTGTAGLDHPAEFVDGQRNAEQVDGQDRFRDACSGESPAVCTTAVTRPAACAVWATAATEPREVTSTSRVSTR